MKGKVLLGVSAAAIAVTALAWPSDHDKGPDERVGARLAKMCPIAKRNVNDPVRGVSELGNYYADNTPSLLHDFAETVAMIERIDDPAKHDRRAQIAHQRMFTPISRCARDLDRFFRAIDEDEEASAKWAEGVESTNRTIGILLGNEPDFRSPDALLRLFEVR
jgi:hypothetical protein